MSTFKGWVSVHENGISCGGGYDNREAPRRLTR